MSRNAIEGGNQLIAELPPHERREFLAAGETLPLALAQRLGMPGEPIAYAWFPTSSFVSMIARADAGSSLEVRMVGSEGMAGVPLVLGVERWSLEAVVQGSGEAFRIAAAPFLQQLEASTALQGILRRYAAVTLAQLAQTAACTRFHLVEERLARWLLMTQDRARSEDFHLTHDFLAAMLGVRRVGVTEAASSLQQRGLIRYHRGDIHVEDSAGLAAAACSCYQQDLDVYAATMRRPARVTRPA